MREITFHPSLHCASPFTNTIHHCAGFAPESRITFAHFATSCLRNAAYSAGVLAIGSFACSR